MSNFGRKKMINFKKKKTNIAGSWTRQILCALLIGCSGLAVAGSVSAKDSAQQFSQRAGNAMNQALTHAHKGEHQKAIDVLQVELAGNDLSPAEFGVIYQMMGQYNYELDRSDESLTCLLYTSPSPRDKRQSRMPSSA